MKSTQETNVNPIDSVGTSLITAATVHTEDAGLEGIYYATCVGPREIDRERYIKTRDELSEMQNRGILFRLANFRSVKYLEEKLAGFELVTQWTDIAPNTVVDEGKKLALDTFLAGSTYSAVEYLGLISLVGFTAIAATDTMAQLAGTNGWKEAGTTNAPTYSGTRKTCAFSSATGSGTVSKSLSTPLAFSMTGGGTVKGCFVVCGPGAVSTILNTSGTLYSAGLFSTGDQPVVNGNTLNVSYTAQL